MKMLDYASTTNPAKGLLFALTLSFAMIGQGCDEPKATVLVKPPLLIILGIDCSKSFKGFKTIDTSFFYNVCAAANTRGGLIVAYGIGNPNDLAGIRCIVKPLPLFDSTLVLSAQAELSEEIKKVAKENSVAEHIFVEQVRREILSLADRKQEGFTDVNGFFAKAQLVMAEPENSRFEKYLFVYSDGIQSRPGIPDQPSQWPDTNTSPFKLCLAGWKTAIPCRACEIKQFESPAGFISYLKTTQ